ncbi:hypothetical protein [Streptomyces prasinosporus]|uniref:hypothetical protein n=1 Tax=Streptomyces prasinosporus TaxID=68256 RepID=UPI0031EC8881
MAAARDIGPEPTAAAPAARDSPGRPSGLVSRDLVVPAADRTGRRAGLSVVGPGPGRVLRTSGATAAPALDRAPHARRVFEESSGSPDVSVTRFTARRAGRVRRSGRGARP